MTIARSAWRRYPVWVWLMAVWYGHRAAAEDPVCLARWPNLVRVDGGARVLVALRHLSIPWYIRQGVDITPGADLMVQTPEDITVYFNRMEKPSFSLESFAAAGTVPSSDVDIKNLTLAPLDFHDYMYMEPEESDALIQQYGGDPSIVLVEFKAPDIGIRFGQEQKLFVSYRAKKTWLEGCNIFFYAMPSASWLSPTASVAYGGELINVGGEQLQGWDLTPQMVRIVHNNMPIHVYMETVSVTRFTFRSPPMILNATDNYLHAEVYFTLNTQVWYPVPVTIEYRDTSRVSCNEAISITNYQALHFALPKYTLIAVPKLAWPYPGSGNGVVGFEDARNQVCAAERLWVIREPHGHKPCTRGAPITCGSVIRLQNMVTHTNLHSTAANSPGLKQQEVSHHGANGHGTEEDNWVLECEPATGHGYAPDWKSFTLDKKVHTRRFEFLMEQPNAYWRHSTIFKLRHNGTNKYLNMAPAFPVPDSVCGNVCNHRNLVLATGLSYDEDADRVDNRQIGVGDQPPNCDVDRTMSASTDIIRTHCVANGHAQMKGKMLSGGRDGTRFFVNYHDHVAFENDLNSQVMVKRFLRLHRRILPKDFVVWRTEGERPCEHKGTIMVGYVHQVFEQARVVEVEAYVQIRGFFEEYPVYSQSLARNNFTLDMMRVYGPLISVAQKDNRTLVRESVQISLDFAEEFQQSSQHDRGGDLGAFASS